MGREGAVDPESAPGAPEETSRSVEWLANGKPKVYVRRWFVLLSLGFSYFGWNMMASRHVAISPTYALYFDIPNEVTFSSDLGVDFMPVWDSVVVLFSYFWGAYFIDRYGLKSMIGGSFAIALGSWIWLASGTSYYGVIAGRSVASLFGTTVPAAILAVSNRWFPESERGMATAIGSLFSLLGNAAALLVAPIFYEGIGEVVELRLKSCESGDLDPSTVTSWNAAQAAGTALDCTDETKDAFCCYQPANIEALNMFMAVMPTLFFIFTALSVRDLPPTAPSPAAEPKDYAGLVRGLKMLFTNPNFAKLALSDFIVSGPVLVLYASLARVFPAAISEYAFAASAAGIGIAIPAALVVAYLLDRSKLYYFFTAGGYVAGTVLWILASISVAVDTSAGNWAFFVFVIGSVALFISWQVSVFECKLEYVFNKHTSLEGWIVGSDRAIINLATLVFVTTIVPERVGGAVTFYIIGGVIMVVGCIPVLVIREKYTYMRTLYDRERRGEDQKQVAI